MGRIAKKESLDFYLIFKTSVSFLKLSILCLEVIMDYPLNSSTSYAQLSQKVAEAIKAVLEVDVTIMDGDMLRIAGTGIYEPFIGKKIEENSAFYHCLESKISQIITDREDLNAICRTCSRKINCLEQGLICVPILKDNKCIGVIGVVAFDVSQRTRIQKNRSIFLNFLEKMAELLEAKYAEEQMKIEKKRLNERILSAINLSNAGIVLFATKGEVIYKNKALIKLMQTLDIKNPDDFLIEIYRHPTVKEKSLPDTDASPFEILMDFKEEKYSFLASVACVSPGCATSEIILTLQDANKFKKEITQALIKNNIHFDFETILGISKSILDAKKMARHAAKTDSNILIYGESGTGKELFARAIHGDSPRKDAPFIPINCGAIPEGLLESELFGHEKGAFTGAYAAKMGKFEAADNGTVFLDEISEMPLSLQVKLLRILQEKEICRLGSTKTRKIDVRIISATNANLEERIQEGLFREDLYYRLDIIPIKIPPLRERPEDIHFLSDYFLKYYAHIFSKKIKALSKEALQLFLSYAWPGNIRELQGIMEFAVNFETEEIITAELIKKRLRNVPCHRASTSPEASTLGEAVSAFEKETILTCAQKYAHLPSKEEKIKAICAQLRISRATLYRKIGRNLDF